MLFKNLWFYIFGKKKKEFKILEFLPIQSTRKNLWDPVSERSKKIKKKEIKRENVEELLSNFETIYVPFF